MIRRALFRARRRIARVQELARIGAAAVELDRLRRLKAAADDARQAQLCDRTERRGFMREVGQPCWKKRLEMPAGAWPDDGPELVQSPRSTWCKSCRRRQAAHERYRELGRQVAGARSRVTLLARGYRERHGDLEGAGLDDAIALLQLEGLEGIVTLQHDLEAAGRLLEQASSELDGVL